MLKLSWIQNLTVQVSVMKGKRKPRRQWINPLLQFLRKRLLKPL